MIEVGEEAGTAEVVAKVVEDLAKAERHAVEGNVVLVVPESKKVIDLREYEDARLDNPRRRRGTSRHATLASFLEHVDRQHDEGSAVFADDNMKAPSFLAIYDYNERTEIASYYADPDDASEYIKQSRPGLPRFGEHRALYAMPFAEEWSAWMGIAGPSAPWLGQLDFAQALEDRGLEVVPPGELPKIIADSCTSLAITPAGPSQLMSLSRGLIVRADRKVGSAVNLSTGEAKITFEETHAASVNDAPVVVPNGFVLSVPVFRDGQAYALIVRLRYRVEGANVKWKLSIHRPDAVFRDAFYDVTKDVRTKTGLPVFLGTPEA